MSFEIYLEDMIKNENQPLYAKLVQIKEVAKRLLIYTQGKFPYYTPHDYSHSLAVQENLDWIIPDTKKEEFNHHEIFFLITSALLHDWGMIGTPEEEPEQIRENHHIRTEEFFEKQYNSIGLSFQEASIIGRISKGHRKVDLYADEYNDTFIGNGTRIRMRFLAALLRIADETDITYSRTPEIVYYTLNPGGKSEEEFSRHLAIRGVGKPDDEPHKILVDAIARDPLGAEAIRQTTKKIQDELDGVRSIFKQEGINLDIVDLKLETRGFVDKPIGFDVDNTKIVELLIGEHLYSDVNVAIRELVQNAIDSCKVKALNLRYDPEVRIDKNDNYITISDNGLGMGYFEAKQFLSTVGSTFYHSKELHEIIKDREFHPISNFGIGFLSAFLISSMIVIDTKKENEEGCIFTITSLGKQWKYEKGMRRESGTTISLFLNEQGKSLDLEKSLYQYFVSVSVPVYYRSNDQSYETFSSNWSSNIICQNFINSYYHKPAIKKEIVNISNDNVDVILGNH